MPTQYRVDQRIVSEAEAKAEGVYNLCWLDDAGHTTRIHMMDGDELYKVIYPRQTPPFDAIVQQHRNEHPGIDFECWTIPETNAEGQCFHATLYSGRGRPIGKAQRQEDPNGLLLREIETTPDDQFITHTRYRYSGDQLTHVQELDIDGNQISEMTLE